MKVASLRRAAEVAQVTTLVLDFRQPGLESGNMLETA